MLILGLSFGYHDSAVSLLRDGEIIFAAHEERFSRIKNDSSFPKKSINACLQATNIKIDEINYVVYYEDTFKKIKRIIKSHFISFLKKREKFVINELVKICLHYVSAMKLNIREKIQLELEIGVKKIKNIDHHESHAAAAFYSSGFLNSTIITIDGVGEEETLTISLGRNNKIKKIKSNKFPHSLGLFYSTITAFLGFEINEGEYKVMGLAAFGNPIYKEKVERIVWFKNGSIKLNMEYFNFIDLNSAPFTKKFIETFGAPVEESFYKNEYEKTKTNNFIYYANLASSFQSVLEDLLFKIFDYASFLTKNSNYCYSGGVALNAVANSKLQKKFPSFFIYPAAGDAGAATGAALYYYYNVLRNERVIRPTTMYLGKKYNNVEIKKSIEKFNIEKYEKYDNSKELFYKVSELLASNNVIGWFSGRSEFGPRALGARSIIANPGNKKMKNIINSKIKFRESFRPFAPMILAEKASDFFDIKKINDDFHPANFMISVYNSKPNTNMYFSSALNVDNTARIQLIPKGVSKIRKLLEEFYRKTKLPILINTSFNRKGEAIVESPYDALNVFLYTDIDYLVLENFLIKK